MKYNISVPCGLISAIRPGFLGKMVMDLRKKGIAIVLDLDSLPQCCVTERDGNELNKSEELGILVQLYKHLHTYNREEEEEED